MGLSFALLLFSTRALTGEVETLYQVSVLSLEDSSVLVDEEPIADDPLDHFNGKSIQFSYPSSWALDTTLVSKNIQRFTIESEKVDPAISIAVYKRIDMDEWENLTEYLVHTFKSDDQYERYYLRQLRPQIINGLAVKQIQYASVLSDELSAEGLKSDRGIRSVLFTPEENLVVVDLSASYTDSYGNYQDVDWMNRTVYSDLIASMAPGA